jgi:cytochrome c oxidase cbb3-type subunit 3
MTEQKHVDSFSGTETTGHEWDGIRELNNPLPRWWVFIFGATVIWGIAYWVAMPSWPLISSYSEGMLGYSQRAVVTAELDSIALEREPLKAQLLTASLDDVESEPDLLNFALASGKAAFGDNCAPCHGSGAQGAVGYPNLNDDEWLWGGTLSDIEYTITHGIRNENLDSRYSEMPAFLDVGTIDTSELTDLTDYVLFLSGGESANTDALARGAELYTIHCESCHMADGTGDREQGAPSLVDQIWLYGSDREAIRQTIAGARNSSMPAWGERLEPSTVRALAIYVHTLGGGE